MNSKAHAFSAPLSVVLNKYKRYQELYRSLRYMNAAGIVNEYLCLEDSTPLPFSLAHGIYPYGLQDAMNCTDIEPWHWSFNDFIHDAVENKNSILLPHPWLLLASLYEGQSHQEKSSNKNAPLLVGLPPSKVNDCILLDSVRQKDIVPGSILVKPRGPYLEASMAFWLENGIQPLVAQSYRELYVILMQHSSICCPSLSSIIYFASAIDLNVQLLTDVPYYVYDLPPEEVFVNDCISSLKAGWAKVVSLCSSMSEIKKESLDTLGAKYLLPPDLLALKILEHISKESSLECPGLRRIFGRSYFQERLHDFLAIRGMSFPSLYKDGFGCLIKNRALANLPGLNRRSSLACIRFPSIDDQLSDYSPQVISRHAASLVIQSGFGASV
jgi:hypothetical protein